MFGQRTVPGIEMRLSAPRRVWRPLIAALAMAVTASTARADAGYDPDSLFTSRDGWQLLHAAPDWTRPLRVAADKTRSAAAVASGSAAMVTDADGQARDQQEASADAGASAVSSGMDAQDVEPEAPALAGVRYRILDRGDETPPEVVAATDRSYAFLRASAKDLGGNPIGAQQRADDEDEQHVRRMAWDDLPGGLALAIRQMPYHARWEVFVPNSSRPAGKGGAYRILRNRPLIFDVERMPAE